MHELLQRDIQTILTQLADKTVTASELIDATLGQIERHNPRLGALADVVAVQARRDAERIDAQRHAGQEVGPLAGLPVAIKENIDTTPAICAAGLPFYGDYRPDQDAPVVQRLRHAGAVVVGTATSDPGAFGVRTDATIHPQAPDRSVGGSSGGSAASVAAGFAYAALGSDTGGSVRIPAACCLTASLKPTYGRVPTDNVRPLAWSLDHVGPMTRRVADLGIMQRILDPGFDATRSGLALNSVRVGVDKNYYADADLVVREAMDDVIRTCQAMGCDIVPVRLPEPDNVHAIHGVILLSDATAYYEQEGLADHVDMPVVPREGIDMAQGLSAPRYAYALHQRQRMTAQVQALFGDVDILIAPTLPVLTPLRTDTSVTLAGREHDYTMGMVRYTSLFNHTGNPVVAMPTNVMGPGLGIGLQVVGRLHHDAGAVAFAEQLEAKLGLIIDRRVQE